MLARLIVYFAYLLNNSRHYRNSKMFFYNLLENPDSKLKTYFDLFMIGVVMASITILIHGVNKRLGPLEALFEHIVVTVFIIEYLLRGWIYSDSHQIIIRHYEKSQYLNINFGLFKALLEIVKTKLQYVFSMMAIIDLLAILPSYRPVRMLRVFLIFRLFKLFRYSRSIKIFSDVLENKRFEFYTLALFLGFLVFIASTAIYMFEHNDDGGGIGSLFEAAYWSVVTLSTVGFGDITPQTTGGRLVTMALIVTGLGVISFFTSIVVTSFSEKMDDLRTDRIYSELEKYRDFSIVCGFGRVGQEIAREMTRARQQFMVIDNDPLHVQLARRQGILIIADDASKDSVLLNAGINKGAATVLCTTADDVANVYITLSSRYLNPDITIISRANHKENVRKLQQAGADYVIQPFMIAGMLTTEYIGQPVAFEAILGILHEKKHILMETIVVHPGCHLENMAVGNTDFTQRKLTLVGVISADPSHRKHHNQYRMPGQHFYFNPGPNFILRGNDVLVLLGRRYSIDYLKNQLEKSLLRKRIKNR